MTQIYHYRKKTFRYDFDHAIVEYISKADEEMLKDEAEWKANHNGRSLFGIDEDGYMVCDSVGLRRENWRSVATRNEYLDEWIAEMEYEARLMARDFEKYELPHYINAE